MIVGGNIVSVKDNTGNEITSNTHIGLINQYRYRGYRYDAEIGLYYLQSRLYNPQWGRFLNADGMVSTGQGLLEHNMYIYCLNNPMNFSDPTGTISIRATIKKIVEKVINYINNVKSTPKFSTPISGIYNSNVNNVSIVTNKDLISSAPSGNVVVLDDRTSINANMQIRDSYKITDSNTQRKVLEIVMEYNEIYPSEFSWNRTMESLIIEWDVHNIASMIPVSSLQSRTMHADFDNDAETLFKAIDNHGKVIQSPAYQFQKGRMMVYGY